MNYHDKQHRIKSLEFVLSYFGDLYDTSDVQQDKIGKVYEELEKILEETKTTLHE